MRICDLDVGEFYIIKPTTKKKVLVKKSSVGLRLSLVDCIDEEKQIYKESYFQYLGRTIEKVEKRIDSKKKNIYTYRPHKMLCLKTGLAYRITSYYIQTYFTKPTK